MVKNQLVMQETQEVLVLSLGWEDPSPPLPPSHEEMATHSSILTLGNPIDRGTWRTAVHGGGGGRKELDTTERARARARTHTHTHTHTHTQRGPFMETLSWPDMSKTHTSFHATSSDPWT